MEFFLLLLIGNFALSFLAASVAKSKGRSQAGFFFLSLFLSFILAILVLIAMPSVEIANNFTTRKCPFCQEVIQAKAVVCKHCGRDIEPLPERVYAPTEKQTKSYYVGLTLTILGAIGVVSSSAFLNSGALGDYIYWALGLEFLLLISGIYLIGGFGKKSKGKSD